MTHAPSCQVAVLTSPGRGAVASLVVFGPSATATVDRLFAPATPRPLEQFPVQRIIYGRWATPPCTAPDATVVDSPGEELVVVRRSQQSVEIHCHGGVAAVSRIVQSLAAAGCVGVDVESWLASEQPDRLVAEAQLAIAQARTTRTAAILLDQVQGSLTRALQDVLRCVEQCDDLAEKKLDELLRWARLGWHLTNPWQIALMGPTNAGKSSLINALLGYQRALVGATAGTTRDVLTDVTAIDGWPVELADTAGLRHTGLRHAGLEIEREGMRRAQQQAASADLVLLVTDLTLPWPVEQQRWVEQRQRPYLLVHNKKDLVESVPTDRPAGILTSARTASGIEELVAAIARCLVPCTPPPRTAVPFLDRHEQTLRNALQALHNGAHEVAAEKLKSLLCW